MLIMRRSFRKSPKTMVWSGRMPWRLSSLTRLVGVRIHHVHPLPARDQRPVGHRVAEIVSAIVHHPVEREGRRPQVLAVQLEQALDAFQLGVVALLRTGSRCCPARRRRCPRRTRPGRCRSTHRARGRWISRTEVSRSSGSGAHHLAVLDDDRPVLRDVDRSGRALLEHPGQRSLLTAARHGEQDASLAALVQHSHSSSGITLSSSRRVPSMSQTMRRGSEGSENLGS